MLSCLLVVLAAWSVEGAQYEYTKFAACDGIEVRDPAYWRNACLSVPDGTDHLKLEMGDVNDFYKPIEGKTFCSMLQSSVEHLWTNDPTKNEFLTPGRYAYHGGGSARGWPTLNVDGDSRSWLGFWGDGTRGGGCCHYTKTDLTAWGRKFTMYYSGPTVTTTTVTTTTITATTTTNTVLKALHERLEELENLDVSGDIKVVVDSVKTLESTLESQADTIGSQAEQIVSLKDNMAVQEGRFTTQSEQNQKVVGALEAANIRIDELLAAMEAATSGPLARPDATGDATRCSSPAQCPPSVESAGSGGDLALRAAGGKVLFESDDCAETDLCELSRDVQAILAKFGDGI